jgi:Sec-independent protein translocase protein TatA
MALQTTFYIVGIICMTLYTLLLLAVVILLLYIKKKINELTDEVQSKIEVVREITSHPKEVAATVGAAVAQTAIEKASQLSKTKNKKR